MESSCIAGGNVSIGSVKNNTVAPQKIKHRFTMRSNNSASGHRPQRIVSKYSSRYLYTSIHSSIIHKRQKVEAIRGRYKREGTYVCYGLFILMCGRNQHQCKALIFHLKTDKYFFKKSEPMKLQTLHSHALIKAGLQAHTLILFPHTVWLSGCRQASTHRTCE